MPRARRRAAAAAAPAQVAAAPPQPPPRVPRAEAEAPALPLDLLPLIFAHLNGWQLSRCVSVCRAWRAHLCGTEEYWRKALAADFVASERARSLAWTHGLVMVTHMNRFRRVPSALRCGALRHAQIGVQAMRRERDLHVPATLQAAEAEAFDAQVEAEVEDAAAAAGAAAEARLAEFRVVISQAAARKRDAQVLDPRCWGSVAPRERVTWSHHVRGNTKELGRARLAAAHAALRAWWLTVSKPFALRFAAQCTAATVQRRQRGLTLPLALQQDGARAAYLLYQMLAASLLRGRCRCCNRETADVHATLRVPMCAVRQCAGAYPIRRRGEAPAGGDAAAQPQRRRPAWRPRNAGKRKAKAA